MQHRTALISSDRQHSRSQIPLEHAGKEDGHEQMLGQAAAVLVSLSTLLALEVIGLLAILCEVLAFTCSAHTSQFRVFLLIVVHLIKLVVLNCALTAIHLAICTQAESVTGQACRW